MSTDVQPNRISEISNAHADHPVMSATDMIVSPEAPSAFVERYLEWDDAPISFNQFPFMRRLLDDDSEFRLMVWARQVGKTFNMSCDVIATTSLVPRTSAIFISSAMDNAKIFNNQKLKVMMESPKWNAEFYDDSKEDAIIYKRLKNGSDIILRGGFGGGGRIRGISAGNLYIDELQDVERDVVEAAESVMTRAKIKRMLMGGTQSNLESSVNHYWDNSDRREWMWLCSHCNRWSDQIVERNIGKKGLICGHCGGLFNLLADRGEWIITGARNSPISSYRFPLLSLPGHPWRDVLIKQQKYSPRMFHIDVLALPFDFSSKPISATELRALCVPEYVKWMSPEACRGHRMFAGIDWGHNLGSTTQICVLKEDAYGKLRVVYFKKMVGFEAEPKNAVVAIGRILEAYGVNVTCADWGGQWESNPELQKKFGAERFHSVQLVGNQSQVMQFNKKGGFWTASKVQTLNSTFSAMRNHLFILPDWALFAPFGQEILNEFLVFDEDSQAPKYEHPAEHPDDSLHAMNFALMAYKIATGEYRKLPVRQISGQMFSAG